MKDPRDPLSSALQSWRHEPSPAPGFNAAVHERILAGQGNSHDIAPDSASPVPRARFALALDFRLSLPLAACLAVLLAGAAGVSGAFIFHRTQTSDRMALAYVRTVDPLLMTASRAGHTHSQP